MRQLVMAKGRAVVYGKYFAFHHLGSDVECLTEWVLVCLSMLSKDKGRGERGWRHGA